MRRTTAVFCAAMMIVPVIKGCASTQLNMNALDIASSFSDLYTRQVLNNLSRFIDEPYALPSQLDFTAGTIQTSNSVTPSVSLPLGKSVTRGATGAIASTVAAAQSMSISAGDSWQQNWNVSPISDANTLRNLQALYRHAVYRTDLQKEYHVPRSIKNGQIAEEPYWLKQPQCVVCEVPRASKSRMINPNLKPAWLLWDVSPGREGLKFLGQYGKHSLYMTQADYDSGVLANFVLFVLPNGAPSEQGGQGKGGAGGGGRPAAAGNRPNAAPPLAVPPQIVPAPAQ